MATFKITYNPFTVKTRFEHNGELMADGPIVEKANDRRLQLWIDEVLRQFVRISNTRKFKLIFCGTTLDESDVRDAVRQYTNEGSGICIEEEYETSEAAVDEKVTALKKLFEEAQDGPFDEFRSEMMHQAFEKALAPEFEVNVLATMSAGKSTVVNAMLGKELMPSKNEACTATVVRIVDHDDMDDFLARQLSRENTVLCDWRKAGVNLIAEWNENKATSTIEISGNIPAIQEREGVRLVLIDTPGPNNSRNDAHGKITAAIMSDQPSMVLYILNTTQLSANDDQSLLVKIREAMSAGGREAQDRFIFIVNKIDVLDPEKGESVSKVLVNVKNYLVENGIKNPLIIPVSAELTKLLRIEEFEGSGVLSRSQRNNLSSFVDLFTEEQEMNMLEHSKLNIDRATYRHLDEKLSGYIRDKDYKRVAELLSGIPIVEALLDNYISKHAIPIRLKDATDTFQSVADKTNALINVQKIMEKSQEELSRIVACIENINNDKKRIEMAKKFRERVTGMEYKESSNSKNIKKEIDTKFNSLADKILDDFDEEVKPGAAKKILTRAVRGAEVLIADACLTLEENLKNELLLTLSSLRDDYQKYISELLDSSLPEGESMQIVKDFQGAVLKMPNVSSLIQGATYEKEVGKTLLRTERYGFLWLKKRDIYEKDYEDYVDMSDIAEGMCDALFAAKIKSYDEASTSAKENFEKAKLIIVESMDQIDERLSSTINELKMSRDSQKAKEESIKTNKDKITWFDDFSKRVNLILSINN